MNQVSLQVNQSESKQANLTFSWGKSLSYRNQAINLQSKSMGSFLYDSNLRHERINARNFL